MPSTCTYLAGCPRGFSLSFQSASGVRAGFGLSVFRSIVNAIGLDQNEGVSAVSARPLRKRLGTANEESGIKRPRAAVGCQYQPNQMHTKESILVVEGALAIQENAQGLSAGRTPGIPVEVTLPGPLSCAKKQGLRRVQKREWSNLRPNHRPRKSDKK